MLRIAIWFFVTLIFAVSPVVLADTLMTMKEGNRQAAPETPGDMDRGGKEVQLWSRPGSMARVDSTGRMIFSVDRDVTYMINDTNKTCHAFPHPEPDNDSTQSNEAIEVRNTGQSRKIGPWQADGYELSFEIEGLEDPVEVTFWVSDELTTGLDTYRANVAAMATPHTAWMDKMLGLGGFPVYQESRIGQMVVWSEVVSVSDETAPKGIYDVPQGYTGCSQEETPNK